MGDQLYLERFVWFDNEARKDRFPNATRLAEQFELSVKSAQGSVHTKSSAIWGVIRVQCRSSSRRWGYFTTRSQVAWRVWIWSVLTRIRLTGIVTGLP